MENARKLSISLYWCFCKIIEHILRTSSQITFYPSLSANAWLLPMQTNPFISLGTRNNVVLLEHVLSHGQSGCFSQKCRLRSFHLAKNFKTWSRDRWRISQTGSKEKEIDKSERFGRWLPIFYWASPSVLTFFFCEFQETPCLLIINNYFLLNLFLIFETK